jgi:2-amino-4-hydroxy-6-hydroxymethyldihydropteridine diphosphokinase
MPNSGSNANAAQKKRTAYIALGSNLSSSYGNPAETLRASVVRLASLGTVDAVSSLYETDPVDFHGQPVFVNAAMALETELDPVELLDRMLALEREFGRERTSSAPKGPRTLDLDLLLVDDLVLQDGRLTLPHPALAKRRFVLAPLAEIAPHLRHPLLHQTVVEMLESLPDEGDNQKAAVRRQSSVVP